MSGSENILDSCTPSHAVCTPGRIGSVQNVPHVALLPLSSNISDVHSSSSSPCESRSSSVAKTSRSHGVSAHVLSVGDYQSLIDHGWRRSGGWLYRPELKETCCRAYTIRLETEKFAPTRGQKRVERKLEAYLCGGGGKDAADADADAARRGGGKSADAPAGDAAATAIEAAVRRALTAAGSTPGSSQRTLETRASPRASPSPATSPRAPGTRGLTRAAGAWRASRRRRRRGLRGVPYEAMISGWS